METDIDGATDATTAALMSIRGRATSAMGHQPRTTIPPRRESGSEIREDYDMAATQAVLAKEAGEGFQEAAREAHTMRRFLHESRNWDEACHATVASVKHRENELRLREEELHLYSHLDEENEHKILQGRLEYTQRRIIRLRDEKELLRLKSTIAHLEQKIYDCNYKVDMLQKQIHAENLHEKSRGRPNGTFGSVWAENYEYNRPRVDASSGQEWASRRLASLKYAIGYTKRTIDIRNEELRRNEEDWSAYKEKMRLQKIQFDRLDESVRRNEQGLPPIDYDAQDRERLLNAALAAQDRVRLAEERRKNMKKAKLEAAREAESKRMADVDAQSRWEIEYGEALEEDPAFTSGDYRSIREMDETSLRYAGMNLGADHDPVSEPLTTSTVEQSIQQPVLHDDGWGIASLSQPQEPHESIPTGWDTDNVAQNFEAVPWGLAVDPNAPSVWPTISEADQSSPNPAGGWGQATNPVVISDDPEPPVVSSEIEQPATNESTSTKAVKIEEVDATGWEVDNFSQDALATTVTNDDEIDYGDNLVLT